MMPGTREEAGAIVARVSDYLGRFSSTALLEADALLALARLGIYATFPTDEVRMRMARAMCRAEHGTDEAWEHLTNAAREYWLTHADAALTALSDHEKEGT